MSLTEFAEVPVTHSLCQTPRFAASYYISVETLSVDALSSPQESFQKHFQLDTGKGKIVTPWKPEGVCC